MKILLFFVLLLTSCSGERAVGTPGQGTSNDLAPIAKGVQVQDTSGQTWLKLDFEGISFQSSNEVMAIPDKGKNQIHILAENLDYIIAIDMEAKRGIGSRFGKGYVYRKKDNAKIYDTENENVGTVLTLTIEAMDDFQMGGFMKGTFTFTREEADGNASNTENGKFRARLGKLN